jgi:NAD(P)-dependent dehydrogenase (short-subunit alcohol dehydrogenase family)
VSDTVAFLSKVSGSSSSSGGGRIHGYTADLSDLSAVRRLAAAVAADHPRLTALVNNAGVYETQRRWVAVSGLDGSLPAVCLRMATNYH